MHQISQLDYSTIIILTRKTMSDFEQCMNDFPYDYMTSMGKRSPEYIYETDLRDSKNINLPSRIPLSGHVLPEPHSQDPQRSSATPAVLRAKPVQNLPLNPGAIQVN
ncbi:MAG: hypothetical protein WC799_24940 [Desulfobacteraceae bacterium]